jgi:hypothetical protein
VLETRTLPFFDNIFNDIPLMIQYLLPHNRRGLNDNLRRYFPHKGRKAGQTWLSGEFSAKRRGEEVSLPTGQKTDTIR